LWGSQKTVTEVIRA